MTDSATYVCQLDEMRPIVGRLVEVAEGIDGKFVVATFGTNPNTGESLNKVLHVANGPNCQGKIVAAIETLAKIPGANVYIMPALVRSDLEEGRKGSENDVVVQLALVVDFDDPEAKHYFDRLPVMPQAVVETSPGRVQAWIFLAPPAAPSEVKPALVALVNSARSDPSGKDCSHVFRVPGLLNYPTKTKLKKGRAPEPVASTLLEDNTWECGYTIEELGPRISAKWPQAFDRAAKPIVLTAPVVVTSKHPLSGEDIRCLLYPEGNVDRSERIYAGVQEMKRRGYSKVEAVQLLSMHANSPVVSRYEGDINRLKADVERIWGKQSELGNKLFAALQLDEGAFELSNVGSVGAGEISEAPVGSEVDITKCFVDRYRFELRYVAAWNRWYQYDGQRWVARALPAIWNLIKPVVTGYAADLAGSPPAERKKICSKTTIANVEALARGAAEVSIGPDDWDADPWLLNTPAGIVDLRTGNILNHGAQHYCTKIAAIGPIAADADLRAACPLWFKFLDDITAADADMQAFLQRMAGYCLTGRTSEHALFFAYGTGGNGKGVFLNTMTKIWADYAGTAPVDTFTESHNDRHPTDLAMLKGARLVTAQETDQGRRWAEAKVKMLTGGDPVTARFMHQDFFTYQPQFKLVIAGNHKPRLKNVDEAMSRRLHLLPFTVTIPEERRDRELSIKLEAEWPGILRWAIDGCLEWQRVGLVPPQAVKAATNEYFVEQDPLAGWVEDRCSVQPGSWTAVASLYADYTAYMAREKESVEGIRRFSQLMESRGFRRRKGGAASARGFAGLALKEDELVPLE